MITLKNVSKVFSQKAAVKDVSLDVKTGEVLAIIGPSGSGKTTVLKLMALLLYPDKGSILIQGVDTDGNERQRRTLRRSMSVVFQYPALFDTTVLKNATMGLTIRDNPKRESEEQARRMLDLLQLSGLDKRTAKTLSGGEAQRVALARALVTEPKILLLDEATANLDPRNVNIIEDMVKKTNTESGTTVILATHNLNQARRLAHKAAFMLEGGLVEVGEAERIFEDPQDERTRDFIAGRMIW